MKERSLRKYLIYALGEILLIVLGILIALQINTWSEQRKDREKEIEYLQRLKTEFISNLEECEKQIQANANQSRNAILIANSLSADPFSVDVQGLVFAIRKITWFIPINITRDTWEELKSTGNISLIRSNALKTSIAGFYSNIDFALEIEKECQTYYLGFKRSVGDLFSTALQVEVAEILQKDSLENIQSPLPSREELLSQLSALEPFNGFLADIIDARRYGENIFVYHKAQAKEILQLIDAELKSRAFMD